MRLLDLAYMFSFTILGILTGFVGKAKFGLSFTTLAIAAILLGIVISVLTRMFCVKEIRHMYQHGKRDHETGKMEVLDIPIAYYHEWYSASFDVQIYLLPLTTILGGLIYILISAT